MSILKDFFQLINISKSRIYIPKGFVSVGNIYSKNNKIKDYIEIKQYSQFSFKEEGYKYQDYLINYSFLFIPYLLLYFIKIRENFQSRIYWNRLKLLINKDFYQSINLHLFLFSGFYNSYSSVSQIRPNLPKDILALFQDHHNNLFK